MVNQTTVAFGDLLLAVTFLLCAWLVRPGRVARQFAQNKEPRPRRMLAMYWVLEAGFIGFGLACAADLLSGQRYAFYILFLVVGWLAAGCTAVLPDIWRQPVAGMERPVQGVDPRFMNFGSLNRTYLPAVVMMWSLLSSWAAAWVYSRVIVTTGASNSVLAILLLVFSIAAGLLMLVCLAAVLSIRQFNRPEWLMPPRWRRHERRRKQSVA